MQELLHNIAAQNLLPIYRKYMHNIITNKVHLPPPTPPPLPPVALRPHIPTKLDCSHIQTDSK